MKNIKRMAVVAVIMGSIALFLSSCGNTAGGSGGSTSGGTFTLNAAQKAHYEGQITYLVEVAQKQSIPASAIKSGLEQGNKEAKALGYQIEDTQAGQNVAQGTQADALRKRFVPKKA